MTDLEYFKNKESIRHHEVNELFAFIEMFKWNIEDTKQIERIKRNAGLKILKLDTDYNKE